MQSNCRALVCNRSHCPYSRQFTEAVVQCNCSERLSGIRAIAVFQAVYKCNYTIIAPQACLVLEPLPYSRQFTEAIVPLNCSVRLCGIDTLPYSKLFHQTTEAIYLESFALRAQAYYEYVERAADCSNEISRLGHSGKWALQCGSRVESCGVADVLLHLPGLAVFKVFTYL